MEAAGPRDCHLMFPQHPRVYGILQATIAGALVLPGGITRAADFRICAALLLSAHWKSPTEWGNAGCHGLPDAI